MLVRGTRTAGAVLWLLAGCSGPPEIVERPDLTEPPRAAAPIMASTAFEYRIGPGDVLRVNVFEHPQLSSGPWISSANASVSSWSVLGEEAAVDRLFAGNLAGQRTDRLLGIRQREIVRPGSHQRRARHRVGSGKSALCQASGRRGHSRRR